MKKGTKHTIKTKIKLSDALKGRTAWNNGQKLSPLSEKHKHKISKTSLALNRRYNPTRETNKKISKALLGHIPWNKGKINIYSTQTKAKISNSLKGHIPWNKNKKLPPLSEEIKNKIKKAWNTPEKKQYARERRLKQKRLHKDTSIEVKIQNFLKELKIEYFTHQYINIKHACQCDILIPSMNLVIECDGNYWHNFPIGTELDNIRTKELIEKGFKVLRLWEVDIRAMDINKFKQELSVIK